MASADDLRLLHAGLERLGDVRVDAVDHRRRHVEQRQLVDVLHLARLQHGLLAVAHLDAFLLQREQHRRLDHVDAERHLGHALVLEDRFDLPGCVGEQGQIGADRAAHAEQPGAAVILVQPRRVELVVARGAAEVPDVRIAGAGEERVARELVARPFADHRARGVADVVLVEGEQRAEAGVRERGARAREAIVVQAAEIDALLEIHLRAARRLQRPVPAVLRIDVVRTRVRRRVRFLPFAILPPRATILTRIVCVLVRPKSSSRSPRPAWRSSACRPRTPASSPKRWSAANLRGVDSHGVVRLPHYATRLRNGTVKARPNITARRTGPSAAVVEGDAGMGQLVAVRAMQEAISLAKAERRGRRRRAQQLALRRLRVVRRNGGEGRNDRRRAHAHRFDHGAAGHEAHLPRLEPDRVRRARRARAGDHRHVHHPRGVGQGPGRAPGRQADPARLGRRQGRQADHRRAARSSASRRPAATRATRSR